MARPSTICWLLLSFCICHIYSLARPATDFSVPELSVGDTALNYTGSALNDTNPVVLFCNDNRRLPKLKFDNCAAAFLKLVENELSSQLVLWGDTAPRSKGHLPLKVSDGDCVFRLDGPSSLVPAAWKLSDYIAPVASVALRCVRSTLQNGGHVFIGPPEHRIVAEFESKSGKTFARSGNVD